MGGFLPILEITVIFVNVSHIYIQTYIHTIYTKFWSKPLGHNSSFKMVLTTFLSNYGYEIVFCWIIYGLMNQIFGLPSFAEAIPGVRALPRQT